jgi:glycosyltransferase involved in cell wall biosynthesis
MLVGLVTRKNHAIWGGDLKAIQNVKHGLEVMGHKVMIGDDVTKLMCCDFIFLTNTCISQSQNYSTLKSNNKNYGVINFHEDFIKYFRHCDGFVNYTNFLAEPSKFLGVSWQFSKVNNLKIAAKNIIYNRFFNFRNFKKLLNYSAGTDSFQPTLTHLEENPEVVLYYTNRHLPNTPLINIDTIRDAKINIANSGAEKNTILRDVPTASVETVFWTAGFAEEWDKTEDTTFLEKYNLISKNYILQVGRLEVRKNQIATLLALKDVDEDLVFICSAGYQPWYESLFINLIKKFRKNRTLVITQTLKNGRWGNFEIINTDGGEKLALGLLKSAYQHSKVHCHPAFYELPGYTYLEALYFNIPTIASEWTTIGDYLDFGGDKYCNGLVEYVLPHDIKGIRDAYFKIKDVRKKNANSIFERTSNDVGFEISELMNSSLN